MGKTIIHIGLHKTGTTFLQENVFPYAENYTFLSRPYTQHNYAFNRLQYEDDTNYDEQLILNEINNVESQNLLISDESFSGKPIFFSYINRSLVANRLSKAFPEAEIILFIRDQKDAMISQYSSYLKMSYGIKKFHNFFYKPLKNFSYSDYRDNPNAYPKNTLYFNTNDFFVHFDCYKYSSLVDLYCRLFKKCHVFLFEDFLKNPAYTISRLEDILKTKIVNSKNNSPVNISLSPKVRERFRLSNKISLGIDNRYIKYLIRQSMKIFPIFKTQDLDSIASHLISGYYTSDNILLKNKLPQLNWNDHPEKYK